MILRNLELMATQVLDITPRWDHVVSAKTYSASMVKTQLLQHSSRGTLPDKISGLVRAKDITMRVWEQLGVSGEASAARGERGRARIGLCQLGHGSHGWV